MTNIISVTYGYARVSKTDDATRNLETQIHILQEFGIREEHILADEMTGSSLSRPAWNLADDKGAAQRHRGRGLAGPVQPEL